MLYEVITCSAAAASCQSSTVSASVRLGSRCFLRYVLMKAFVWMRYSQAFRLVPGVNRITSYNVCYTKLLRFTTGPQDSRSTRYCTDIAKGYQIPILHVNGDDPEACVRAARMAFEYREAFGP